MRSLIKYFIDNSLAANMLMFSILILGTFGALNTKRLYFPVIPEKIIMVQAVYPGASPQEVEEGIITKVEASVVVETEENVDIDAILRDVKNGVDAIASFPTDMESIRVYKQEIILDAIVYTISGNLDLKALKKYARDIEDDLLATEGISQVDISGFPEEEIEIAFRENDLRTYQLSLAQATQAVRSANLNITSGTIKGATEDLLLRANNKGYSAVDFRNIIVKTSPSGSITRLHQVADIKDKWEDNPGRSYIDGEPAITIKAQYTKEEDIIKVADQTKAYFAKFITENPAIKVTLLTDESEVIKKRLELLIENGLMGFFLVVLLLAMFLNWRLAFWVAIAIPISFAGMFIFASYLGESINVVSSFGMIMVLGILVDDGIVICEIDGQLGDFFSSLAVFVIFALLFSLIEGAFILPNHVAHSQALAPNKKRNWLTEKLDAFMRNRFFMFSIVMSLLIFAVAAVQGGLVRQDFFPSVEGNNVIIRLKLPAGTNEAVTLKTLNKIEAAVWEVNKEISEKYLPDSSIVIHVVRI